MKATLTIALLLASVAGGCTGGNARADAPGVTHVAQADAFTRLYGGRKSPLGHWQMRANAAGSDCGVLYVQTPIILEDSLIEALHYGAGPYEIYSGGVRKFCRDGAFRAVAYRDGSGRIWTYGNVTQREAEALTPCR